MAIREGDVVEVFLDPPNSQENGKVRPAVVVVVSADGSKCDVVAISSKLEIGDQQFFVDMPFSKPSNASGGNANSGLSKKCVAKVFWHTTVDADSCKSIGFLTTKKLIEVKAKLEEYLNTQTLESRPIASRAKLGRKLK